MRENEAWDVPYVESLSSPSLGSRHDDVSECTLADWRRSERNIFFLLRRARARRENVFLWSIDFFTNGQNWFSSGFLAFPENEERLILNKLFDLVLLEQISHSLIVGQKMGDLLRKPMSKFPGRRFAQKTVERIPSPGDNWEEDIYHMYVHSY